MIVAIANRKMIKLDASFIRLSPSKIVTVSLGIFNPLKIEVAAMASGGDIIPPNKKPSASENPGMIRCNTTAIADEVKITRPNANKLMERLCFQNSYHKVFHAAEK